MHVLHALPHDIIGRCMQLLLGLYCFDFISDIPLCPATLVNMHFYFTDIFGTKQQTYSAVQQYYMPVVLNDL
jgi:hypothetical protein